MSCACAVQMPPIILAGMRQPVFAGTLLSFPRQKLTTSVIWEISLAGRLGLHDLEYSVAIGLVQNNATFVMTAWNTFAQQRIELDARRH